MRRTDILNELILLFGYNSYLEIGVGDGTNFRDVSATMKVSVDPSYSTRATHRLTSDSFFARNTAKFDLIFIDGLHEQEQVLRDLDNSLAALTPNGCIVLHDCSPQSEEVQVVPRAMEWGPWTGDVWKAIAWVRMHRGDLSVCVLDTDYGCGIVRRGTQVLMPARPIDELTFSFLSQNRRELLNLVSYGAWRAIVSAFTALV